MQEDQIRRIMREELAEHRKEIDEKFTTITNTLTTGLDGKPGLIQNQKENAGRIQQLEKADAIRDRTVWAAAAAIASSIAATLFNFLTGSGAQP